MFTYTYMTDLVVGDREENINGTLGEKSDGIAKLWICSMMINGPI